MITNLRIGWSRNYKFIVESGTKWSSSTQDIFLVELYRNIFLLIYYPAKQWDRKNETAAPRFFYSANGGVRFWVYWMLVFALYLNSYDEQSSVKILLSLFPLQIIFSSLKGIDKRSGQNIPIIPVCQIQIELEWERP